MATKLGICNAALVKLGQEEITALTDNNKRAKLCNNNYDRLKRMLIRRHPWNFAKKRVSLSSTGATPSFEYSHMYALPVDFIRLDYIEKPLYEHAIEGDKLLYNGGPTIKLVYIADADESTFDSLFEDLLATTIAYEICTALTNDQRLKSEIRQELEYLVNESRSINAQTRGTPQDTNSDELLVSRRAGSLLGIFD